MTVRRWMKKSPTKKVRSIYDKVLPDAIYQLVQDGILTTDSESYKLVLKNAKGLSLTLLKSLRPRNVPEKESNLSVPLPRDITPFSAGESREPKATGKPKKKIMIFRQTKLEMG